MEAVGGLTRPWAMPDATAARDMWAKDILSSPDLRADSITFSRRIASAGANGSGLPIGTDDWVRSFQGDGE